MGEVRVEVGEACHNFATRAPTLGKSLSDRLTVVASYIANTKLHKQPKLNT